MQIEITTKSGKTITIDEDMLRDMIDEKIDILVEEQLGECDCSFNEGSSHCDCDGNLTEDDYEIKKIEGKSK